MKLFLRLFLSTVILTLANNNYSQTTTTVDFETEGDGYTPSGVSGSGYEDLFNRTNADLPNCTNEDGYFWGVEDMPSATTNPSINLSTINLSGATSFTFSIDLLAHHYNDWDFSDEFRVTYSLDGGSYQNLMWIESVDNDGFNTPAALDLGFDEEGDCGVNTTLPSLTQGTSGGCTVSSSNFATFTTNTISLSNNTSLDIKLQFTQLTSADEGLYIDNISITTSTGSSATTPSAPTISSIENGEGQVIVNFIAGSDGGATITDFEYSTDGGSSFTSMGTTSSPYTISGLTNGTDYNIQIRAVNSEGAGAVSNTAVGSPIANELTLTAFNSATTENFNTLASSGTATYLPSGIFLSEQGNNANSIYSTGTGTSGTGDTYSLGSNGDSDRALGGVASNGLQTSFGAKIRNETGTTLNSVLISYTGESWKVGSANRIDRLDFQYSTDATSLEDGTWTDFDNLDYVNTGQ
ncbi:MAG: fibronectin type III domain-containing protein, partial [Crocinitomicaceae bacterium]|nr:fibronectin type III domain-containing protein [Crocinitomicaceae bacterium]